MADYSNSTQRSLEYAPTWALATVSTVFVVISFAVERLLHRLGSVSNSVPPPPPQIFVNLNFFCCNCCYFLGYTPFCTVQLNRCIQQISMLFILMVLLSNPVPYQPIFARTRSNCNVRLDSRRTSRPPNEQWPSSLTFVEHIIRFRMSCIWSH